MKNVLIAILAVGFMGSTSFAEETVAEKVSDVGNTAGRKLKKGANRVKEAFCTEGDLKCAAKKGKNRLDEGGSAVKDGATDLKNKVD